MTRDTSSSDAAVRAALRHLGERAKHGSGQPGERVTLDELARATGYSTFHLQRSFVAETGMSPREVQAGLRLAHFRHRVRAGEGVADAGYASGFGSSRGLYDAARAGLGMTPGRYARGGAGLAVIWTIETCALGRVLVSTTERGVCAVMLGDDDAALETELAAELPRAERSRADGDRAEWVCAVVRHLDDVRLPLGAPLDPHGTPFQLRVWRALRDIPPGETRTYAELAAELGSPGAARAVGSACARNAIAVLVPCHRVVRADGGVGGYRWGPARKRALLAREAPANTGG